MTMHDKRNNAFQISRDLSNREYSEREKFNQRVPVV